LQRIVFEDLEDRHDGVGLLAQNAQELLAASAEDAIGARETETVDNVLRHPERDLLRDGQELGLGGRD
jgi:F420-dependent methylenetetrahydromethanopterin dehydrogenase